MQDIPSKIEELIMKVAEWRTRFLVEREWRETVQKEKKEVEEKYSQIVYELGTQKKMIEHLEERVALLASGHPLFAEDEPVEAAQEEELSDVVRAAAEEAIFEEAAADAGVAEPERFDDVPEAGEPRDRPAHPTYTNPYVYEPKFHFPGNFEPTPHLFYEHLDEEEE